MRHRGWNYHRMGWRIDVEMNPSAIAVDIRTAQHVHDQSADELRRLIGHLDALMGERQAIAETLACFYRAELSASALQPVLELAVRLTPELARKGQA